MTTRMKDTVHVASTWTMRREATTVAKSRIFIKPLDIFSLLLLMQVAKSQRSARIPSPLLPTVPQCGWQCRQTVKYPDSEPSYDVLDPTEYIPFDFCVYLRVCVPCCSGWVCSWWSCVGPRCFLYLSHLPFQGRGTCNGCFVYQAMQKVLQEKEV